MQKELRRESKREGDRTTRETEEKARTKAAKQEKSRKAKSERYFVVLPNGLGEALGRFEQWENIAITGVEVNAHTGFFIPGLSRIEGNFRLVREIVKDIVVESHLVHELYFLEYLYTLFTTSEKPSETQSNKISRKQKREAPITWTSHKTLLKFIPQI